MKTEIINVYELQNTSRLSSVRCADLAEAAAVCLDWHNHPAEKTVAVEGDFEGEFILEWGRVSQRMRDSRNDMDYSVESGAYCLAMLIVEKLTNFRVSKQSKKKTGFDYWLGEKDENEIGMQDQARLEVSGILNGSTGQVNQRLKEKIEQTKKSDNLNLPAYVVIVEFSQPLIKIRKR